MAESWLNNNFSYSSTVCANSADLQAAIAARMIAAGWSNPSANTYKSPDATRWVQVVFSQPAADKLEIDMTEYLGRVAVDGRVGTVSNPSTWKVHVNTFGFMVWNSSGAGFCFGGILDHFPQAMTSHNLDVYFGSYLSNADGATGHNVRTYLRMLYNGSYSMTASAQDWPQYTEGSVVVKHTVSGARRESPVYVGAQSGPSASAVCGRHHQTIQCDSDLAKDAVIRSPIDDETVAEFIVTGVPADGSNPFSWAVRKS